MLCVNLWDGEFKHCLKEQGFDASSYIKPEKIQYVRDQTEWDGITLFTNDKLQMVDKVKSRYKVAWMIEARAILPNSYKLLEELEDKFDYIITYYEDLLLKNPAKYKQTFVGATRIPKELRQIYNKTEICSLLVSNKNATDAHKFRHVLADILHSNHFLVTIFGGKYTPFANKIDAHKNFMFSIVITNSCENFYFTEYLIDCLLCGTIPIFYGCPAIGDFFNIDGILHFTRYEEINDILLKINPQYYYSKMEAIKDNFQRAQQYLSTDDLLAECLLKNIVNKVDLSVNIIVLPHQGLGDQIIMNGYVNHLLLNKNVNKVVLVAKEYQRDTLEHLYRDSQRVSFFYIQMVNESSSNNIFKHIPLIKAINNKPFNSQVNINNEIFYIHNFGVHSNLTNFIVSGRNWADSFYLNANLDSSLRHTMFKLPTDMKVSYDLYNLLKEYIQGEQYILIHDDPSRDRYMNGSLVKSTLEQNNHICLPVIYLGKNRNQYPFIQGLNNKGLPDSFHTPSLLNLYHIIYNATECHFMDSSVACLTDTMKDSNSKLYLHYYMRENSESEDSTTEVHSNRKWVPFHI